MPKKTSNRSRDQKITPSHVFIMVVALFILPLFLPLIIPIAIFALVRERLKATSLANQVKRNWFPNDKYILLVYSNSPNWKEYFEEKIIPKLKRYSFVLNFSEKYEWKKSADPLAIEIFKTFSGGGSFIFKGKEKWGGHEYNPVIIAFLPGQKKKILKFWQAMKDFKHGKDQKLRILERELFEILEKIESLEH